MKQLCFAVAFLTLIANAQAQDYKTAIGARIGLNHGITLKHFFSKKFALEGLLSTCYLGPRSALGANVTALAEWHFPIVERFKWFIGGGIHTGVYFSSLSSPNNNMDVSMHVTSNQMWYSATDYPSILIGVDFMIGLEYKFPKKPISLQFDYKPSFSFRTTPENKSHGFRLGLLDTALSIRYTF